MQKFFKPEYYRIVLLLLFAFFAFRQWEVWPINTQNVFSWSDFPEEQYVAQIEIEDHAGSLHKPKTQALRYAINRKVLIASQGHLKQKNYAAANAVLMRGAKLILPEHRISRVHVRLYSFERRQDRTIKMNSRRIYSFIPDES